MRKNFTRQVKKGFAMENGHLFKSLLVAVIFLLMGKSSFAQWVELFPTNPVSKSRPAPFVIGDTAYIANGDASGYTSTVNGYTPQSNTWYHEPGCPSLGGDKGFNFTIGDTAYVGDGAYYSTFHNDFFSYIPGQGWTNLSATIPSTVPPGGGRAFSCGFSIGHKGYFGMGLPGNNQPFSDFYEYDPSTLTWTQKKSLPVARFGGIAVSINGKGYMGLGYINQLSNTTRVFQDMYRYDPATDKWDTMAPMPTPFGEAEPAYFVVCNKLIITCGQTLHAHTGIDNATTQAWMFDPEDGPKGTWYQLPDFPGYPSYSPAGFAIRDTGYVNAGDDTLNSPEFQMFKYIPNINPITVSPNVTTCAGTSVTLTADGGGAFKWSPSVGLSDTVTTATAATGGVTSVTANPTVTTTYTVTEAVCGQTATIVVTIGSQQAGTASATPATVCNGQSSTLAVTGSGSFTWSPSTGLNNDTTGSTVVANPSITTTYTVSSGTGSCSFTDTVVVTVGTAPPDTANANPVTICSGQITTLTATGGNGNFTWSPAGLNNNATGSSITATPLITTTYTVTSGSGGCISTDTVVVTVANTAIGGSVTAVRDTICQNTPGNLSLSGNTSSTLQWQSSTDSIHYTNDLNDTLASYKTAPLQQTTWYHVLVGKGSCSAISDSLKLYVPPALTASFYSTQTSGTTLTFNSDSSSGNIRSYHWDFGDGQTSNEQNPQNTYAKDSTYYVCLTLYDGSNCSYTFCRYSSITDAVQTISASGNWVVYPDPFENQLAVGPAGAGFATGKIQSIEMYDVLGRVVLNEDFGNTTNTSLQLDVSSLAKGMYYVMIRTANADYVQKVVKQ